MNSSNFNTFIEDFSSITPSETSGFERILRKHPYFQTAALFLAKSNPVQQNTQMAALRSADRRVLRSWLDEKYRQELEKEKQEAEAKKTALEAENNESRENLDIINTESINAFDKLVGTTKVIEEAPQESKEDEKTTELEEKVKELENSVEETEILVEDALKETQNKNENLIEKSTASVSFFDEIEDDDFTSKTETIENKIDSSSFFDDLEGNEDLEKAENTTGNSDENFFDKIDSVENAQNISSIDQIEERIFEQQSDIHEPLINVDSIPAQTTDANFFDEVESAGNVNSMGAITNVDTPTTSNEIEENIFEQQSDVNEPLTNVDSIPTQTTDANFFDEVDSLDDSELKNPIYNEQLDLNEPLNSVPPTTTDANFFDEVESDDAIFKDAQKNLDVYDLEDFPDFEDEKEEIEKNQKANKDAKDEGSFFDDI